MTMRGRHRVDVGDDRGSVSLWAVLVSFSLIIMVGIAVDFGGQAVAEQHARSVAGEAARAGGQEVQLDAVARGRAVTVSATTAALAAQAYLHENAVAGTATATGPNTVTVTVTGTYPTRFLSIIGIETLPVTGSASATVVRTFDGAPR